MGFYKIQRVDSAGLIYKPRVVQIVDGDGILVNIDLTAHQYRGDVDHALPRVIVRPAARADCGEIRCFQNRAAAYFYSYSRNGWQRCHLPDLRDPCKVYPGPTGGTHIAPSTSMLLEIWSIFSYPYLLNYLIWFILVIKILFTMH